MVAITTSLAQLRADHPFFNPKADPTKGVGDTDAENNPAFARPMTAGDEAAFERWIGIKQKDFSQDLLSQAETEDDKRYVLNLFIAHYAQLIWLPRQGLLAKRAYGDQPSVALSEGGISLSWSRQTYQEFLESPFLSYTDAGAELAEWLRTYAPLKGFVI